MIYIERLLTVKDIKIIFDCGSSRAREIMNSKSFPSITIGKRKYVSEKKLNDWIESYSYKEFKL